MPQIAKNLPPSPELLALSARINRDLPPQIRIDFFLIELVDGPVVDYRCGCVYQCGALRHTKNLPALPTELDIPEIKQALDNWATEEIHKHRWTEDPDEADANPLDR